MIFFVYTQLNQSSIEQNLGLVDYSYFFVMQKFLPVLRQLAPTFVVGDAAEVNHLLNSRFIDASDAILLCFAPPHRVPEGVRCRVITVFAWEYSSIPNESWGNNPRQNWAEILRELNGAITHSRFAVSAVRRAVGEDYPITSLPAPVWDEYAQLYQKQRTLASFACRFKLSGVVLDSLAHGSQDNHCVETPDLSPREHSLELGGVIYTTVFNSTDGRKNWGDLMSAFVFAFKDNPNATLLMKLVCSDAQLACGVVWHEMKKLSPYRCRIVAIQGYLDDESYQKLVKQSVFIVNSSYGEGQCLPLMEFMSAGKPAVAPDHSAMADYVNHDNSFVVRSSEEWTHWPHDPRLALRALRYRINWESLRDAFLQSYEVAVSQPDRYAHMSRCATQSLRAHCSRAVIRAGLSEFLQQLGYSRNAWAWASNAVVRAVFLGRRLRRYAIHRMSLVRKEN